MVKYSILNFFYDIFMSCLNAPHKKTEYSYAFILFRDQVNFAFTYLTKIENSLSGEIALEIKSYFLEFYKLHVSSDA